MDFWNKNVTCEREGVCVCVLFFKIKNKPQIKELIAVLKFSYGWISNNEVIIYCVLKLFCIYLLIKCLVPLWFWNKYTDYFLSVYNPLYLSFARNWKVYFLSFMLKDYQKYGIVIDENCFSVGSQCSRHYQDKRSPDWSWEELLIHHKRKFLWL